MERLPRPLGILGVACALLSPMAWSQQRFASQAEDAEVLGEVIVTARKFEETLQDVPMSVQVLSAHYLADADVSSLYELQFSVPGLVVNTLGLLGARLSLRGVSDQAETGRAVAAHVNGVYLGDSRLPIARTFDLERIEVLKGPQGTLYGKNATGGSINFITRPPVNDSTAGVEAAYGSFSTTRVEGHVNLPLPAAAVRLALIASDGNGYIRNSVDDRRFAESDYLGVRASTRFELGDLHIDVMAQHTEDDGAFGELWTPHPDFLPNPRDIRLTAVTQDDPHLDLENSLVTAGLDYDFGFATLHSVSGYARNEMDNLDDCAGTPFLLGCVRGGHDAYTQWSQEVRLHLRGTGRAGGLVGLYYYEDDSESDFQEFVPLVNPIPNHNSQETGGESVAAIFGQATLQLAERWSVTGGLRLSREKQRFSTVGSGADDSPTLFVGRSSSSNHAWRIDVEYAADDDLRLYAGISTGYKSGAIQFRDGELDNVAPENLLAYEAGLKSQWMSRRLTLNAAAFFYDYQDLQVDSATIVDGELVFHIDNAAQARLYGIDAMTTFQLTDRLAVSGAVVWMPMREFTEYTNDLTGDTLSGNKLSRAPETSATAAIEYRHPLPASGRLTTRLEYAYRSGYYYTVDNNPSFAQDAFGLLNAIVNFESAGGRWYAFASGRNLTDEDYFYQVFVQSSPGLPNTFEVGAGFRF